VESIKLYYLDVFGDLETYWGEVFEEAAKLKQAKYVSTRRIVAEDAVTLTDGPTLYLCDDVDVAAKKCFDMLRVPDEEKAKLIAAIEFNNRVNERIHDLNEEIKNMKSDKEEGGNDDDNTKSKKIQPKEKKSPRDEKLQTIELLSSQMKRVHMNRRYIPNTEQHTDRFHRILPKTSNTFTSRVMEKDVEMIMSIDELDDVYKMLLIAGIGVFKENMNTDYLEIMKRLAYEQGLFMIIAGGDYIYGTNYQFCHGYIDDNMTQEKLIQAFGRIGRTNNQLDYSIRLTDNAVIERILKQETNKREVVNMNRLFSL